jgi:signal transduction histidine kinase
VRPVSLFQPLSLFAPRPQPQPVAPSDRNKDRLIAIVAHELRNPLSPIRNAVALLRRAEPGTAAAHNACDIIDRQVGEMARLVDDLLDASRLQGKTFTLRRSMTTLGDIVARTLETTRPFVEAHGQVLLVSLPPEPVFVHADAMRLSQVLQNLVRNAAKFTPRGGRIRIEARRDTSNALLTVQDTGVGIAAPQLEEIFELYSQAGQAGQADPDRSSGGLGIGLYLARSLMQAHGGSLRATSAGPGYGSEFTASLPFGPAIF